MLIRNRAWPHKAGIAALVWAAILSLVSFAVHEIETGEWIWAWPDHVLADIQPELGLAYTASTKRMDLSSHEQPSRAVIVEDGRVLGPANAQHADIRTLGRGRFSFWHDYVYLSASDSSDPRTNGRRYAFRSPPIAAHTARVVYGLTLAVDIAAAVILLALGARPLTTLAKRGAGWPPAFFRFLGRHQLSLAVGLFLLLVIANRAFYFLDFPVPAIHPDSVGYFGAAEQIGNGTWPNFGNRPPVYPLLLKSVFAISDRVSALVVAQTVMSVLASMLLIVAVHRWTPGMAIPAAVVSALFLFGFTTIEHDTAMLSESPYASFLMISFATLLIGLRSASPGWLAAASAAMALAILTRPAGIFLEVSYVIVVAWLFYTRFSRRATIAYLTPFPVILLLMCTYNWRVVGVFATTTWGEANFAGATLLAWQTDPDYPPEINRSVEQIQAVIQKRYVATGKDPSLLETSWNVEALRPIFLEGFNWEALRIAVRLGGRYETTARGWIRRISFDAIRKKPHIYAKFVATQLFYYFEPTEDYDFRAYLRNRAWALYVDDKFTPGLGAPLHIRMAKEFATSSPPSAIVVTNTDVKAPIDLANRVIVSPTRAWRVYDFTHRARAQLYDTWLWPLAALVALLSSIVVLYRTRLRHHGAFAVFILTISTLGACLVVSLVEYSQPRYSYPMEWAYGIAAVLLPALWLRSGRTTDRPQCADLVGQPRGGVGDDARAPVGHLASRPDSC